MEKAQTRIKNLLKRDPKRTVFQESNNTDFVFEDDPEGDQENYEERPGNNNQRTRFQSNIKNYLYT